MLSHLRVTAAALYFRDVADVHFLKNNFRSFPPPHADTNLRVPLIIQVCYDLANTFRIGIPRRVLLR